MIIPKGYQRDAIEGIKSFLSTSLKDDGSSYNLVFKAPTGAGKTFMLAEALSHSAKDNFILWATPGKGELEEQSFRALASFLEGTPISVQRLDEAYLTQNEYSPEGSLVVTNWEEIVQTSQDSHGKRSYSNRLVEGRESYRGLLEHIALTGKMGIKVIVIIDESHVGKGESNSHKSAITGFLSAIDDSLGYPAIRIEASATPITETNLPRMGKSSNLVSVEVDIKKVIEEGMLAKEIKVNWELKEQLAGLSEEQRSSQVGEELILETAWNRILSLREQYLMANSLVKPLLLIQLPNAKENDERDKRKIELVENFFMPQGISRSNGKIETILSDEERNKKAIESISNFNSNIEVLLFKQGISLGWDCPRAQVLLCFREMKSDIFKIQTLGRIIRMPEQKHYNLADCPELDWAFLYSNLSDKETQYETIVGSVPVSDALLIRQFDSPLIPYSYVSRAGNYNDLTQNLLNIALEGDAEAKTFPSLLKEDPIVQILGKNLSKSLIVSDSTISIDSAQNEHIDGNNGSDINVNISNNDLQEKFDNELRHIISFVPTVSRSFGSFRGFIYEWLSGAFKDTHKPEEITIGIWQLFLDKTASQSAKTREITTRLARQAWDDIQADSREDSRKEGFFEFPDQISCSSNSIKKYSKDSALTKTCLYKDFDGNGAIPEKELSQPEENFIEQIREWNGEHKIEWWWKNGDGNRDFFSIAYTNKAGGTSTLYPDFLIKFKSGTIAILETKEEKMEDGIDHEARNKAVALTKYMKDSKSELPEIKNVFAGVIYLKNGYWYLATGDKEQDRELLPQIEPFIKI